MDLLSTPPQAADRRVRRSRAALMQAAIDLVSRHATTAVALSDIAEAADVTRKVAYQQFGDRDTLLLEATLELLRRELVPRVVDLPPGRPRAVAGLQHFAEHRPLYRAVLTSAIAPRLSSELIELLLPRTRERLHQLYGDALDEQFITDLAVQLNGGMLAMITAWLVDGEAPLDAEAFADRMLGVQYFLQPKGEPTGEVGASTPER